MEEELVPGFAQLHPEIIQAQAVLFFVLLLYWVSSSWSVIADRVNQSFRDRAWFGVCLLFGGFFGIAATADSGSEYVFLLLTIGLGLGVAFYDAAVAVSLLTSLLFLRPWEMISGDEYLMILPKLCFMICLGHVMLVRIREGSIKPRIDYLTVSLLLFGAWSYVTTFKAPDPWEAQFQFSEIFMKSIILFLVVTNALSSARELRTLTGTIVLAFVGVGLISIYKTMESAEALMAIARMEGDALAEKEAARLVGIGAFANSNDIAALMVFVFPFALVTFLRNYESWLVRALAGVLLPVVVFCVYLSQSRGALLSLFAAIVGYVALRTRAKWIRYGVAGGLILLLPVSFALMKRSAQDLSQSSSSRMTYIKTGIVMGVKNPVFGVGHQAYDENFEKYATEILYEWGHRTAHNSWVQVFAETGLPGIFLFVLIFILGAVGAWRVFGPMPEYLVGLIGYGAAMSFLSHAYLLYPYLLFAMACVAGRIREVKA